MTDKVKGDELLEGSSTEFFTERWDSKCTSLLKRSQSHSNALASSNAFELFSQTTWL